MKKLLLFIFIFSLQAHSDSLRDRNRDKLKRALINQREKAREKAEKEKKKRKQDKKKPKKNKDNTNTKLIQEDFVDYAVLDSQARWANLSSGAAVGFGFGAGSGSGSSSAGYDPVVFKTMSQEDVFGSKPFEGTVDVNANGQWIACSQNGVFLSLGSPVFWQEVLTESGAQLVNANTVRIQCRISDSGSWIVINRAGIYKNTDADFYIGEAVTNTVGINQVYDLDMAPNGSWIASSSQGTWRQLANSTPTLVLASANAGNGSLSAKRIVKISPGGDWAIMTSSGVYINGVSALSNPSSSNIGGNINYWSLDLNAQGDWAAISSRGTFLNGSRISVAPNPDGSTTIEANDVGEMIVKITDRNLNGEFTWMAISPKGLFRDGERIPDLSFLPNQQQYTLDMNNSGAWIAASESAALLNGNPILSDGLSIQTNNGTANELICKINEYSDYTCLTNNGVFRNEDRGLTNAKLALNSSEFTPTSFKHSLQIATNGAVSLLSEHTSIIERTGVYWGMNVQIPPPPQPIAATLNGSFIDWEDAGGSTAGFIVSLVVKTPEVLTPPTTCSEGSTLYVGTTSEFNIVNFSDFKEGSDHYISLCAINSDGDESSPIHFNYVTQAFRILAYSFDFQNSLATLTWTSLPGKTYSTFRSNNLVTWLPIYEAALGEGSVSEASTEPPEFTMTRTFSDPYMPTETKGFYRIKTP